MISLRPIFFITGLLTLVLAAIMIPPILIEIRDGTQEWQTFTLSLVLEASIGFLLVLATKPHAPITLKVQEVFLLTALSWTILCLFGAVPFLLSPSLHLSFADAVFESTSGLTTTGGTILIGLDQTARGILLWRALLHGIGGIGIVVMALTILPFLRIGGMQLFHSESSDRSEKILPRVSQMASAIFSIYFLLIILCVLCLGLAGMPLFDAVCHSLSVVSTGGFSTHDASIGYYASNSAIQLVLILFMIIGGSTLILFVRFGRGESRILWQDAQMRAYLIILVLSCLFMSLWLIFVNEVPTSSAFLDASFNIVSIITTTGFITKDYSTWGPLPLLFFFFLMFIGGCTGSTTGGIKIFRFQVLFHIAYMHLKLLRRPHGVFIPSYNGKPISEGVILSVLTFFALYGISFGVLACILASLGADFITALSGAVTALGNVGPGLGPVIGPDGTFASLSDTAKWIFAAAMLLGRLELLTIFVLFTPSFWRD